MGEITESERLSGGHFEDQNVDPYLSKTGVCFSLFAFRSSAAASSPSFCKETPLPFFVNSCNKSIFPND
jgi:hypothetical protein